MYYCRIMKIKSIVRRVKKIKDLSRGLWDYHVLSKIKPLTPNKVMINLTYWCNSKCIMCNIWQMKPKKELGFKEWKEIMKDPIFDGIESLTVSGGEAILHPEFTKNVSLFINSMPRLYELNLITNGFLTNKVVCEVREISKFCQEKHITFSVSVSIDGVGKVHEKVRRIPGAFLKLKKTLVELNKLKDAYGFNLGCSTVILRQNLDEVEKVAEWAKKQGIVHSFQIVGFHETFVNNLESEEDIGFREENREQLVKLLTKLSQDRSSLFKSYYWKDILEMYTKNSDRSTPCPFLQDQFVIDSLGDVYYCLSESKVGNFLGKKTISQIYFDPKNLERRKRMWSTVCRKCNSGCDVETALKKDGVRYLRYRLTGKLSN
jgi:MoaA/NifB/PqqE/SkfB family radical SAM enzyme